MQAGKNTHEMICSSLELFGREIMPEFQAREPAHQEWKRGVLAGEIELEEVDTDPYDMKTNQTPSKPVVKIEDEERRPRVYDLD